jgi:CMP-N,N'-diacetyllegionaminic acid synthase
MPVESSKINNLCIIPARGGSKGIKDKNLKVCGDKMLIEWVINAAKSSDLISEIFVSTDSIRISEEALNLGVNALPLRPKSLGGDVINVLDVIQYTVKKLEKNMNIIFENVVLIQPSSPFVTKSHIDDSILKIINENFDTVISAVKAEANHPSYMFTMENNKLNWLEKSYSQRRQILSSVYLRVGNVYTFKRANLFKKVPSIYGDRVGFIEVEALRSITIDAPLDLVIADNIAGILEKI